MRNTSFLLGLSLLVVASGALAAGPMITPAPREAEWAGTPPVALGDGVTIVAGDPREQQVGRLLASELHRLHGIKGIVETNAVGGAGVRMRLVLRDSAASKAWLEKQPEIAHWKAARNAEESYWLDTRGGAGGDVVVVAPTPRGLWYGCQTLLQLIQDGAAGDAAKAGEKGSGKTLAGALIRDWPQLSFRAVHICIFPNTELPAVRQAILLASRYRCNAVVIEPWASIKSKKRPETAYESAYTPEQVRPLIDLGRALHMEMIPMLNSWGHASGMRSTSFEHVVLDRFPQFKSLYEPDGWSFNLSNPAVYEHLFDRYGELLELFGPDVKYFHVGMDEAWGHLGLNEAKGARGDNPRQLLLDHIKKLHGYFAQRKIRIFMWHDMFLERDHPTLGKVSPANGGPPINTHLVLPELPRDVILAAWNYGAAEWPVPKYFADKGFPVVVSPWKHRRNTVGLLNAAKRHDLMGMLATTWDSLDVALPSVAQAGVLAWTTPDFELKQVPFDHWVAEIRKLPIDRLPRLEESLKP